MIIGSVRSRRIGFEVGICTVTDTEGVCAVAGNLRFSPDDGHIQLFDQRMLLMHASSFAELRRELIERLDLPRTRDLLTRLGYQQGFPYLHGCDSFLRAGAQDRQLTRYIALSPSGVLDAALARGRREITLQTLRQADNLVPD